jgi:putative addiction module component (TIGR02574 family)
MPLIFDPAARRWSDFWGAKSIYRVSTAGRSKHFLPTWAQGDRLSLMSTVGEIESAVAQLPLAQQEELFSRLAVKLSSETAKEFPAREDHLQLLDERFAAYHDDPKQASTWEDVKLRFESRRR